MNVQSVLYKKLLKRCFHSSSIQEKRKSGALAFDAPVRGLSKKQKKRKARRLVMQSEVKDQRKEKIKANHLARQLASDAPKQYLHDMVDKMKGVFTELFLPDGTLRLYEDDVDVNGLPKPLLRRAFKDAHMILYSLRNNKAKQDLLLSANSEEQHTVPLEVDSISRPSIKNNELVDIDSFSVIKDTDIRNAIIPSNQDVADVIIYFANYKKFTELTETVTLLNELDIPVAPKLWSVMMKNASKKKRYQLAEDYFDLMIKSGVEPDQWTWSALVHAKVKGRGTEAAMEQIEVLKRTGVQPTVHMFTTVLNSFLDKKQWPEAHNLWIRMHCEQITLSVEAFTSMLRHCIGTGNSERAFFYIDEMQSLNLEPDLKTYQMLFRAVAEAPHWVDGYHDVIFDAMCKIEGAELKADTTIYNTVIYAFARAGDSAAAEYYFWEMRRKGLAQNDVTYNSLMFAYSAAQTVGAKVLCTSVFINHLTAYIFSLICSVCNYLYLVTSYMCGYVRVSIYAYQYSEIVSHYIYLHRDRVLTNLRILIQPVCIRDAIT
jgi:pentatricopeptide repeat protein